MTKKKKKIEFEIFDKPLYLKYLEKVINLKTDCSFLAKIEKNFIGIANNVDYLIEYVSEEVKIKIQAFKQLKEIYIKKIIIVMVQKHLFPIRKTEMNFPTKLIVFISLIQCLK